MASIITSAKPRINLDSLESRAHHSSLESREYSRNRTIASVQLAIDAVRANQEIVKNPPRDSRLKPTDKLIDKFISPIAPYICYAILPTAFAYGFLALKYSQEKDRHILE